MSMPALTDCGAVPVAGETDSHAPSSPVLNDSVPPPVLEIASAFDAGFAPPRTAEKLSDDGDTPSAGGDEASTVSVTGIVLGEPVAPGAVTVTVAVYVPGLRPPASTDSATLCGAVPLAGDSDSQLASSDAL